MYLRMLLIQGAKSAVITAQRRDDPISKWPHQLRENSGWQKVAVAMASAARIWGRTSSAISPSVKVQSVPRFLAALPQANAPNTVIKGKNHQCLTAWEVPVSLLGTEIQVSAVGACNPAI